MSEYLITKRDQCEHPTFKRDKTGLGRTVCADCRGTGYIDTSVDLLEVLAKLVWGERWITDDCYEIHSFQGVRIVE